MKDHPLAFGEIVNNVEVYVNPRVEQAQTTIFDDSEVLAVPAGLTAERWCIFTTPDGDPCTDIQTASFTQSGSNIHIESQTDYSWASLVVFHNTGANSENVTGITIDGKPVSVVGRKIITASDTDSIRAYGKLSLTNPIDNKFIQDEALATAIAESLLASYKTTRRDVTINAFGYIDLELGDRIEVVTYLNEQLKNFALTSQDITIDHGVLRATYKGRRIE
jgi:hypothetical protein